MKKKKILSGVALGAAMAGMMLSGAGCTNQVQDLYGPPPDTEPGFTEQLTEDDLASPAETLYGPPADLGTEASADALPSEEGENENTEKEQTDESEAPSEEERSTAAPLYGPPPSEK